MPNEKLIRDVVNYIETHPSEWNQELWYVHGTCGTSYCFAGCALLLSGKIDKGGFLKTPGGFETNAKEVLGLTDEQADALFYGMDTYIEGLRDYVTNVTGVEFDA